METLDKVDMQILRPLQQNARLTTKELASRVSLSSTPVFERLKRLENNGYIKKYIAVLVMTEESFVFLNFALGNQKAGNKDDTFVTIDMFHSGVGGTCPLTDF